MRTRIDQHLRFFDTLERIRWQFTATFGGGAGAAIVLALDDKASLKKQGILLILVFGLCLAGLVTQVRIFALTAVLWCPASTILSVGSFNCRPSLWKRMLLFQTKEFELLPEESQIEKGALRSAWFFPRLGVLDSIPFRSLSVGMVSCFLFALLIGIGTGMGANALWHSHFTSIALGLIVALLFMVISLIGGKRYAVAVEGSVVD